MVLLLMFFFSLILYFAEKYIVGCRDWFDVIVNLLPYLRLLMYAKYISFMVVSSNVYGIIFYQMYLTPCLTTPTPPPPIFTW